MTLEVWATQNAVDTTGSGTTDFVHGSITTTPVAALHCWTHGTVNGTAVNQMTMGVGMSDGTTDLSVSISSQHDVSPTNTSYRRSSSEGCVSGCFTTGASLDGAMSHNSFIAGGQRLNNDNAFASARLCNSLFFDCDNAKTVSAILDASVDTAVNVDPGFAWDVMIVIGVPRTVASGQYAEMYMGFFDKTNQGCIAFNSAHNNSSVVADVSLRLSDTYVGMEMGMGTGTVDYAVDAVLGSGTSVNLFPRTDGGDGDPVYCLFLGWASDETVKVVSWDSPTATGSNQVTSVGFEPQGCIHLLSFADDYDVAEAGADAGAFGIAFETADDQFCVAVADEYNTGANSDTQALTDNQSINVPDDGGAATYDATLTNYLSNGWDHNWAATETGVTNRLISLAFEASSTVTIGPRKAVERLMRA